MPVPGLSLLGLKRIRGFASILRYINPTIIIMFAAITVYFALVCLVCSGACLSIRVDKVE